MFDAAIKRCNNMLNAISNALENGANEDKLHRLITQFDGALTALASWDGYEKYRKETSAKISSYIELAKKKGFQEGNDIVKRLNSFVSLGDPTADQLSSPAASPAAAAASPSRPSPAAASVNDNSQVVEVSEIINKMNSSIDAFLNININALTDEKVEKFIKKMSSRHANFWKKAFNISGSRGPVVVGDITSQWESFIISERVKRLAEFIREKYKGHYDKLIRALGIEETPLDVEETRHDMFSDQLKRCIDLYKEDVLNIRAIADAIVKECKKRETSGVDVKANYRKIIREYHERYGDLPFKNKDDVDNYKDAIHNQLGFNIEIDLKSVEGGFSAQSGARAVAEGFCQAQCASLVAAPAARLG
jgi:hypothetical protein